MFRFYFFLSSQEAVSKERNVLRKTRDFVFHGRA